MNYSIVFLCAVVLAVLSFANSTNTSSSANPITPAQTTAGGMQSSVNGTTKKPTKPKPTSTGVMSSAIFGVVLSFSFACLLKNL